MHEALKTVDTRIASQVAKLPVWVLPLMTACTILGLPAVIITASISIAGICYWRDAKNVALAFGLVMVALAGNGLLKLFFHRNRPDTLYVQSMAIKSHSFPSGHAFGAIVFYGLIAYLCYRHLDRPLNMIAAAILGLLVVAIGLSRIYLGAHFPSDVFAGWLLGGMALAVIIKVCNL